MTVYASPIKIPVSTMFVGTLDDSSFYSDSECRMVIHWLVDLIKVIVRAWYDELMTDDTRKRFSLLELD